MVLVPIVVYFTHIKDPLIRSLIYIGCLGGIGGTIYCIRGFYQNLGQGNFNFAWTWWYLFRPFISVIVGIFVYFLIVGGLLSIGSANEINYEKGVMLYCAIAFLAGFSFTQFADKLEELASTLFSKKKEGEK
ncbi:MAG: hypothetical protein ACOC6P_04435 [Candidatus Aminicenantaceae bacterium]